MEQNILEQLTKIVEDHEKNLSQRHGGTIDQKVNHVLGRYEQIAANAIWQAKTFLEDAKTQYKALEIITEGLTDEGLNHTQKRTIANHIIRMLRSMVDKLDQVNYEYSTDMLGRYNFYRSQTPERRLFEEHRRLKDQAKEHDSLINKLKEKHPEILNSLQDEIPF